MKRIPSLISLIIVIILSACQQAVPDRNIKTPTSVVVPIETAVYTPSQTTSPSPTSTPEVQQIEIVKLDDYVNIPDNERISGVVILGIETNNIAQISDGYLMNAETRENNEGLTDNFSVGE